MSKPVMGTTAGATQLRLKFDGTTYGTNVDGSANTTAQSNTRFVSVARLLSQANHRLYRQGRMYMVRVGFHKPGEAAGATVSALPNTWMTRKAWVAGRKAYLKAMRNSGVKKQGRWNDFQVNFDLDQYNGNGTNQTPFVTLSGASVTGVDSRPSQVAGDSGASEGTASKVYQFHWSGDSTGNDRDGATGSFGLIAEYSTQEDTDTDDPEDTGTTSPFVQLEQDEYMASANQELAIESGDAPPYDPDLLENARSVDYVLKQAASDSIQPVTPWIAAPGGLLKITGYGSDALAADLDMYVEVMAGGYKGVMSEPI